MPMEVLGDDIPVRRVLEVLVHFKNVRMVQSTEDLQLIICIMGLPAVACTTTLFWCFIDNLQGPLIFEFPVNDEIYLTECTFP